MSRVRFACILAAMHGWLLSAALAADAPAPATRASSVTPSTAGPQTFETAEKAADALIDAAEKFDVTSLIRIVGPQGEDLVLTGEYAQDRERAQ